MRECIHGQKILNVFHGNVTFRCIFMCGATTFEPVTRTFYVGVKLRVCENFFQPQLGDVQP